MNITCISTSRIPSDTANSIQVMKAVHGLAEAGHAVRLLLPDHGEQADWEALAERYGLEQPFAIERLPTAPRWKNNDFALRAVRRACALHSDLIYTWTSQSAVIGLLAGLPAFYEFHDLPTGRLGPVWLRAFRWLRGRKRLLPITQALRRKAAALYGDLPDEQVVISPNGVDLAPYVDLPDGPQARRALGLPEQVIVLCSGHLYSGRGGELFLDLAARCPSASFVWVGGRPQDVERCQEVAASRGLENVRYTGFVSQRALPGYLAAADVLLMPYQQTVAGSGGGNSAEICSPMKMFDYLAAGRAILSSDLPVIHEVLDESSAAFARPDDLQDWSDALARLLEDDALRGRLAVQARAIAGRYTWRVRAERALAGMPG